MTSLERREPELLPDLQAGAGSSKRQGQDARQERSAWRRPTSARRRCRTTPALRNQATTSAGEDRASRSPARPRTRSSSTCGSSTCCTAATSPRPATTPSPGSTSTRSRCRCPRSGARQEAATPRRTRSSASGRRPTARSRTATYRQVSRLGMPLVNEVVIPLKDKDKFNASKPTGRRAVPQVRHQPGAAQAHRGRLRHRRAEEPRNDLVSVFLTGVEGLNQPKGKVTPSEQLRLNMSTPVTAEPEPARRDRWRQPGLPERPPARRRRHRHRAAGRRGRARRVRANDLGDGVDANDVAFGDTFPYLALPASGSNADPHPSAGAAAKQSSAPGPARRDRCWTARAPWPRRRCGPAGPDRRHRRCRPAPSRGLIHPERPGRAASPVARSGCTTALLRKDAPCVEPSP